MGYGFAGERRAGWKGTAGEKAINPVAAGPDGGWEGVTKWPRESLESRDQ